MHYLAFNKEWFSKHQKTLLWFLNFPLTKRWARLVLRIRSCDVGYQKQIVQLLPDSYTVVNRVLGSRVELTTDFRTHGKYAKRLYHAFKPVWWAMHVWDWFADVFASRLSFGFDTLTAYPDPNPETTTVDGFVFRQGVNETWSTIRAGAGNANDSTGSDMFVGFDNSGTTNQYAAIYRIITLFDTSSLTGVASISNAVLSLYGETKTDGSGNAPDYNIYTSTPASNTDLINSDYGQIGTTAQATAITYSSISTSGYNDFTLNATGIGNISKTSVSKFACRDTTYDAVGASPTWGSAFNSTSILFFAADRTGTSQDPKLVITYTVPVGVADVISIPNTSFSLKQNVTAY